MSKGFRWVWEECSWEVANVKTFASPGLILPGLRYLFAIFKLLSVGGWINRKYRYFTSQELKDSGYMYIFRRMDIYILLWVILELLAMLLIIRSPAVMQGSALGFLLVVFGYRLFEIFQAWVNQFLLTYKWDPVNASRSLVLAFGGFWEVTIIGGIVRAATNQSDAWTNSIAAMLLNPVDEGVVPIMYIQIIFVMLFIVVVAKQVAGRMATADTDRE